MVRIGKHRLEQVTFPILKEFESVNSRFIEVDNKILVNSRRIEEIEVFLRRLSLFNFDYEKLWCRIQELELNFISIGTLRVNDMGKIKGMVQESINESRSRSDEFKIGMNRMDIIINQYKEVVENVLLKTKSINNQVFEMQMNFNELKENYANKIKSMQIDITNSRKIFEEKMNEYSNVCADLDIANRKIKGNT